MRAVRELPREQRDCAVGSARNRTFLLFCAAPDIREHADICGIADGRCEPNQAENERNISWITPKKVGNDILDGKPVSAMDRLKYAIGDFTTYAPLKNALGLSRVRVGYTAGEAIGPEIFDFFRSLGINLKQLYGQTEASFS